jgi:hypothetical protein
MTTSQPPERAAVVRAGVAVVAAAVCAVLLVAIVVRRHPGPITRTVENGGEWYARSPGWFTTRGLYPTEHAPDGSPFQWAAGRVRVAIPRISREIAYRLDLHARSGRPPLAPPVDVRLAIDGRDAGVVTIGSEWRDVSVPLPASSGYGAFVVLDAEGTFTPGAKDSRQLAFMIDRLTLTPIGAAAVPVPRATLAHLGLWAAAIALAAIVCGLPALIAWSIGTAAGCAAAWLGLFDHAYLNDYSSIFLTLAAIALAIALAARMATRALSPAAAPATRFAVLLIAVVTMVRVAAFVHPDSPVSDGLFHVHRAQAVRAGNYIFTSVTPRPFYEFPYPIGLYVVAQPAWDSVADRVALLRVIALIADALVALALFAVVAMRWGPGTGVVAAVFALAVPVVTQTISTANLTNAFAQSCFSLALLWIGSQLTTSRRWLAIAVSVGLLSAAYLSHFSTAVIGGPAMVLVVVAVALANDSREQRAWRWIAWSVILAAVLSYVVYYSHFTDVYARTLSKVGAEKAPTSLVATLSEHSESKPVTLLRFLASNYGVGALALAAIGIVIALRRGWRDAWTLTLAGAGIAIAGFLLLGALTPIEMRANLAAQPLVAAFAALGTSSLWDSRRWPLRALAIAGVAAAIWAGLVAMRAILMAA